LVLLNAASTKPQSKRDILHYITEAISSLEKSPSKSLNNLLKKADGKVAQVRVLDEGDFTIRVSNGSVKVESGFNDDLVDGTVIVDNKTIFTILDGIQTPVEAFFSGRMRMAAATDDLILAHDILIAVVQASLKSIKIQKLLNEYRITRMGKPGKIMSLSRL